ncbi:hypothetical protein QQ008_22515 [Fulvivirgaceae bacterium BMA10]|uniref:Uncharacterized protein n=1 Tax=Splendidivirga corallicola TaxID=3051826 RepID=A0ABT8KX45_9BACT|nr:hypothetical protein [Fulvivirgaceae bacterium BMA10]
MELEQMRTLWREADLKIEQHKILTNNSIEEIAQRRFSKTLSFISLSEGIGLFCTLLTALFILWNLDKLDTWYLTMSGILAVLVLIILPFLSLKSIKNLKRIDIAGTTFKKSLRDYALGKKQFLAIIKLGSYFAILIFIISILLFEKIINDRDLIKEINLVVYWFIVPIGIIFQILFSRLILKKYHEVIDVAESILKELNE